MKVVVLVKQVPDSTRVKMDEQKGTVVRTATDNVPNPLDLYAVEWAVRIKECVGARVTAVSMGPPHALEVISEAVAMGCDDGLLLSDKAFAGADTLATARSLARAVEWMGGVDLVLAGDRSTDGETGQVGPSVAARLGWPVLTGVTSLRLSGSLLLAERLLDREKETVEARLPCVVTVTRAVNSPRMPTLEGKRRAEEVGAVIATAESLELDADTVGLRGSPTRVIRITQAKVGRDSHVLAIGRGTDLGQAVSKMVSMIVGNRRE